MRRLLDSLAREGGMFDHSRRAMVVHMHTPAPRSALVKSRRPLLLVAVTGLVVAIMGCASSGATVDGAGDSRAAAEQDSSTVMRATGLDPIEGTRTSGEQPCLAPGSESKQEWVVEEGAAPVDPETAQSVVERVTAAVLDIDGWEVVDNNGVSPVWPSAGVMFSHGDGTVTLSIDPDSGAVTVWTSGGCYESDQA